MLSEGCLVIQLATEGILLSDVCLCVSVYACEHVN